MEEGPGSFDVAEPRDINMSTTNDLDADTAAPDDAIMNSVETDHLDYGDRRESGLSNVSFESDRRPASRSASELHQSARNSYGYVSSSRHSAGGDSERAGGRVSAGDGSSQQGRDDDDDDDVFSDDSPRSSTGSNLDPDHTKKQQSQTDSRRLTGGSRVSDMQPYDPDEEFIPKARETPRPVFRSPSSVRAMQMNSPPPSVTGGGASGRHRRTGRSSVSRIGSPAVSSTQYSPKKTPPRFKRSTPPLVLLHVTLLPLRWPWGDLMDNARPSELSDAGKSLRVAWKQLQARLGDTVSDRGVLLPHPQNDFEVLEERLLEAMELPLRRRARILECGHYLGPATEMVMADDDDDDDDDDEMGSDDEDGGFGGGKPVEVQKRHWCSTCLCDVRYDSLGEGKMFRTKVYASNGLMKAGAWDACWKEMERVDVELEPLVDSSVLDELERIAATQEREAIEAEIAASHVGGEAAAAAADQERGAFSPEGEEEEDVFDAPPAEERSRKMYEERMREIYGQPQSDEAAAEQQEAVREAATDVHHQPAVHQSSPTTAPSEERGGKWAELFKYGFRDVLQLIVFVSCVLLLQYFGIGFEKRGAQVVDLATHASLAPPAEAPPPAALTSTSTSASAASGFASTVAVAVSSPDSARESYAACASALEVAQASMLAMTAATETVTETETVSVSVTVTETPTVAAQPVIEQEPAVVAASEALEPPVAEAAAVVLEGHDVGEAADTEETQVSVEEAKETVEKAETLMSSLEEEEDDEETAKTEDTPVTSLEANEKMEL